MSTAEAALAEAIRHHREGRFPEAEQLYRSVLVAEPRDPNALHLLGVLLGRVGQLRLAIGYLERSIDLAPRTAVFHYSLADGYRALGRYREAIRAYLQSLEYDPNTPETHEHLASALVKAERYEEAAGAARAALRLRPEFAEAHHTLGLALMSQKQPSEAEQCFRQALAIRPGMAEAHNSLGISLTYQRQLERAVSCFEKAIELQPRYEEAHRNLGTALLHLGRTAEGLASFERVRELNPTPDSHAYVANAQRACGNLEAAERECQRGLDLDPESPKSRFVASTIRLIRGNFDQGWKDYEYRLKFWKVPRKKHSDGSPAPVWDGSPLESRTILLYAEQGLGDTIQFVRYVGLVRAAGGRVLLQCQRRLVPLAETSGAEAVFADDDPLPPFDCALPLPSLPGVFGTLPETTPAPIPYLSVDPGLVERWRHRLPSDGRLKIGVVWGGNPDQSDDRIRSFHPRDFAPLVSVPGIALFSLQRGMHAAELAGAPPELTIEPLEEESGGITDTAAILSNLDLLITADTMPAHLAGALGCRVWTLLAAAPDWRWMIEREDTPWYPTMRLFRQSSPGDWRGVMETVTESLLYVRSQ